MGGGYRCLTWHGSPSGDCGVGIWNDGVLTLHSSMVTGNYGGRGAGIFNQGTATLTSSDVSSNTVRGCVISGGGILNLGMLTLNSSNVTSNTANPSKTLEVNGSS